MAEKKTIEEYLDMMGHSHKDKVTGFSGTATGVSFDIAGCVQLTLSPPIKKSEAFETALVIDAKRLTRISKTRVMDRVSLDADHYLDMLGYPHEDRITGFRGTVTSVNFLIAGTPECIVSPLVKKSGELEKSAWIEADRLRQVGSDRLMPKPEFVVVDGPEARPPRQTTRRI